MSQLRKETLQVSSSHFEHLKERKAGGKIILPASKEEKSIFTFKPSDIDRVTFKYGSTFVEHEFEGAEEWGDWIRFYLGDQKLKNI